MKIFPHNGCKGVLLNIFCNIVINQEKQVCTFVLEAAHNVGGGHSSVVLGKSVVQLQHVFWWLPAGSAGPGLGPQLCEVHCGQKMAQKVLRIK